MICVILRQTGSLANFGHHFAQFVDSEWSIFEPNRCQAKFLTSAKYLTKRNGSEISRVQARNT
jgi:hypothetical protein